MGPLGCIWREVGGKRRVGADVFGVMDTGIRITFVFAVGVDGGPLG